VKRCTRAHTQGAVLVFLPGWDDITRQTECLTRHPFFAAQAMRFKILQLHRSVRLSPVVSGDRSFAMSLRDRLTHNYSRSCLLGRCSEFDFFHDQESETKVSCSENCSFCVRVRALCQ
jgi:hypothetical protein